jgi:hypothetical protein
MDTAVNLEAPRSGALFSVYSTVPKLTVHKPSP